jgi:ribose transport system permease protein
MTTSTATRITAKLKQAGLVVLRNQLVGMSLVLAAIIVASQIATAGNFLTPYNVTIIIRAMAFIGLVAIGQSLVLLLGELDLSVGAIAGLSAVMGGKMMVEMGINPFVAFVFAVLLGTLMGLINGTIITSLNLNALVVTIGMSGIYKGINLVITRGRAIVGIPSEILFLGQGRFLAMPIPFVIMILVMGLVLVMTKRTTFGRYIYAIGDSREAAHILGIRVKLMRVATFMITGTLASLAGMLMVARLGSSQPAIGEVWLLTSVAAPVIGGVALTGGVGSPAGALIGVAIIGVIENIIVLLGVSPYWQTVVSGSVVVIAVSIDSLSRMTFRKS